MNRRFTILRKLLGRQSKLTLSQKLLIYNTILKPTWTYGVEVWGSAKASNILHLQRFQSKVLRHITDTQFYVSNQTLQTDLSVPFVQDLASSRYQSFHASFAVHPNPLVRQLATPNLPDNPP